MKKCNGVLKIIADAALVACGMIASACAVPTAFSIPFSIATAVIGCALGALLLSAWMHLPRGGIAPGLMFLFGSVIYGVIRRKTVLFGVRWILYTITGPLSIDFKFIPAISAPMLPEGEDFTYIATAVTSALLLLAAVIGLLLAFSLIRGKIPLLSVLIPLPAFMMSLIYTDMSPAIWAVILLMIYCGGALLGLGLRRENANRLGWFVTLLVPLLLLFALLLRTASPESSFIPIPFEQRKEMLGDRLEAAGDLLLSMVRRNPKQYELNEETERMESDERAFSLSASRSGTYLLRSHSYGQYRNGIWREAPAYTGEWRSMEALGRHAKGAKATLSIKNAITNERHVPYAFLANGTVKTEESRVRTAGKTAYDWNVATSVNLTPTAISAEEEAYLAFAQQAYTMPDGEEKETLLRIADAAGLKKQSDAYHTALTVAAYVKSSGLYTLTPGDVPKGRDFVEYFLTEGHKGYCVHFASATTALLQAMGVPARYTIGYRAVAATADTWIDVTEQSAHAWAEVYQEGVGWIPIESTSGFSYDLVDDSTAQTPATPKPTAKPTATPTTAPTVAPTEAPNETPAATATAAPNTTAPAVSGGVKETAMPLIIGEANVVKVHETHVSAWWLLLLLIPLLPVAWIGAGALIRSRRARMFRQKNAKAAVLSMLRYLERLERFGVKPDPKAQEWAEEATFSNHDMTETKALLLSKVRKTQDTLYLEAPVKRFFVKWILCAI